MVDLGYVLTIFIVTLGPLKITPAFFMVTQRADRRTLLTLAAKSTIVSSLIVLFVALIVSGIMVKWRVSVSAMAIAGGIVLLIASIKTLSAFTLADASPPTASPESASASQPLSTSWMGRPVLSPLAIQVTVPPIGIVVILIVAGMAVGDPTVLPKLVAMLLAVMVANFVAMVTAGPIMRLVGLPVLQVAGWIISALQAGLAVQAIIDGVRPLVR